MPILNLAVALESGDWPTISRMAAELALPVAEIHAIYLQSIEWVGELNAIGDPSSCSRPRVERSETLGYRGHPIFSPKP